MPIIVLDRKTSEKIAAGEVIENPTSVVKELVENALDAGADSITVEIEEGGKSLIAVTDNGQGIAREELPLAFKRFATSKLEALDDLDRLRSLGFRGEALPSIAAVSRVRLVTRRPNDLAGTEINLAGSEIVSENEAGAPPGTRVEVSDLFYNTPGRKKFLRSASAEAGRVSTLLSELALARPATAFRLKSGGKTLFSSPGDDVLLHVVGALQGNDTASAMITIDGKDKALGYTLKGAISAPHLTRSSRRWITVVVNGRLIKNPLIQNALERGYGDLLPRGRHPLAILHFDIPPDTIDVNVHPAKTEIRFQNQESLKKLVYKTVKLALQAEEAGASWPVYRDENHGEDRHHRHEGHIPFSGKNLDYYPFAPLQKDATGQSNFVFDPGESTAQTGQPFVYRERPGHDGGDSGYNLIGQFLNSYLLVQKGDELLIIDQHAAHERIIYSRLKERLQDPQNRERGVQLTIPLTLDIPAAWRERLPRLLPLLAEAGFDLEAIGDDSYVVRAVPFDTRESMETGKVYNLLETLLAGEERADEDYRETIMKDIACRRSVKAGMALSREEMNRLLRDWENTPQARFCPHGRPTVLRFERAALEKAFHRRGS